MKKVGNILLYPVSVFMSKVKYMGHLVTFVQYNGEGADSNWTNPHEWWGITPPFFNLKQYSSIWQVALLYRKQFPMNEHYLNEVCQLVKQVPLT